MTCVEIKFYGAFALTAADDLHAVDATPARWRGDARFSPVSRTLSQDGRVIAEND